MRICRFVFNGLVACLESAGVFCGRRARDQNGSGISFVVVSGVQDGEVEENSRPCLKPKDEDGARRSDVKLLSPIGRASVS